MHRNILPGQHQHAGLQTSALSPPDLSPPRCHHSTTTKAASSPHPRGPRLWRFDLNGVDTLTPSEPCWDHSGVRSTQETPVHHHQAWTFPNEKRSPETASVLKQARVVSIPQTINVSSLPPVGGEVELGGGWCNSAQAHEKCRILPSSRV